MAIIGKIRERSTLVLIIIGGAIVAFVLGELFTSLSSGQQGPINLAEVNGESISAQDFDMKVQEAYSNYQANAQSNEPLDERTKSSLREQVWNEVISDQLLGQEMLDLGIKVTSKELFDMVQGENPHPNVRQAFSDPATGAFNSAAVVQFLQNLDNDPRAKEQWIAFERALKRNQQMQKYNTLISKAVYLPSTLAEQEAKESGSTVSFNYVMKSYNDVNDTTIVLSEKEIESYYNNHLDDYEQKASRKAYYAYFPVKASESDIALTREWANEVYEEFKNNENDSTFVNANSEVDYDPNYYSASNLPMGADTSLLRMDSGELKAPYMIETSFYIQKVGGFKMVPDSVKASHILINMTDRTEEEAEAIADSLMGLLESGVAMSDLAAENSDDVGSGQNGGDLGWFNEGTMVKPFNDAAFSAEIGDFTKVRSQFGIHIIEVMEKTEPIRKIQIATIRRTATAGKDTYANAFNEANSFSIDATDLESFNNLIVEKDIQRRVTILRDNDNLIQGEPASRDIVRWIKEGNENDVSEAYDLDDAFIVAVIEEVNEDGPTDLEKIRARVEFEAKREKKAEMFMDEMAGEADLGTLAGNLGLSVEKASDIGFANPSIPNVGIEPVAVGKAFSLGKGQTSVPIKGNTGVFVLNILEKTEQANPNIAETKASFSRGAQSRIDNGSIFIAIKDISDVTDNRSKFY